LILVVRAEPAFAENQDLTLEELSKTKAAQEYISNQYSEALRDFKILEKKYPQNILIKRYIASLYDALHQEDKAVAKLDEILKVKSDDAITRQMLGDLYVRRGELDKAEEQFQIIHDKSGSTPSGVYAEKKLDEIRHLKRSASTVEGKQLAAQD